MHVLISRMALSALVVLLALAPATPSVAQAGAGACTLRVLELWFGEYDAFQAGRTRSVTRIGVECQGPATKIRPTIELSAGSSQDFARRTQRSGSNVLTYNIYADQALTQIAGDGTSGTTVVFPELQSRTAGGNGTISVDLYGAIDPRQFVPPGSYFDTVYVTLTF